jgi:diguanylate cyclase (GGDEF)-like protein
MSLDTAAFFALRFATALFSALAAWRSWRMGQGAAPTRRRRAWAGAALMTVIGALALVEGMAAALEGREGRIAPRDWLWLATDLLVPVFYLAVLRALAARDAMEAALAAAALTDPLTRLPNRAGFGEAARRALAAAAREGRPLAVAVVDLDHFKRINDGWGHAAGDAVLRGAATAFQGALRPGDVLGRIGGEEFALLLPGATAEEGRAVLERLRVAAAEVPHPGAPALRVSASAGLAALAAPDWAALEAALRSADAALYAAKAAGRNRVMLAP